MSDSNEDANRFEILKMDYEMARDDDRAFSNIQAAVASIAVALLAVIATLVSDTCQLSEAEDCKHVPDLFLSAAPSVPLAALAFLQLLGAVSSIRSYYIRALERELRTYAQRPLTELASISPIRPASYSELITEVTTMRRGRAGYRVLSFLVLVVTFSVFAGFTLYLAVKLDGAYTTFMVLVYGAAFAFLASEVAGVTLGARTAFVRVAQQFHARSVRPLLPGSPAGTITGRDIVSYLVFPRPEDWSKLLFIPLVFVVASASRGTSFDWGTLLTSMVIAEYLVYSARYQWNDIRGVAADAAHPQARARLRLPHSSDRAKMRFIVGSSLCVGVARVLGALLLGYATGELAFALVFLVAVFAVAALYELLRTSSQDPWVTDRGRSRLAKAIWLTVGAGYALRFLVGIHAAGVPFDEPFVYAGAAFSYSFGIMFVLLTWVLEATSYCRASADGVWYQGRELKGKANLSLLLPYISDPVISTDPDPHPAEPSTLNCGEVKILVGRGALFAPWNIALWVSAAAGALLAVGLVRAPTDIATMGWVSAVSIAGGFAMSAAGGALARAAVQLSTAAGIVLATRFTGASGEGVLDYVLLVAPWMTTAGTYLMFRNQSYRDLKYAAADLLNGLRLLTIRVIKSVTGPDTWRAIR
ncbi:hypothetical protein PV755_34235 [Streptomyces caniscabiei]|uniref:Uncharacterized protein n=1 Tax=Streptomyces caniscabiei TaxID=2746961 RepID=A0A927L9Y0_9ACTN|nr:hypothetical protein [Streptomyces caniscabiei]MBD9728072.1 hypothetical protein [Streptomyces caniscabiei]MDX3513912.1 hypothetical protein [Streptomyces caniscabiei]MDX3722914.1 hypothetical protein [Streptomyces caniscabiei]MDX3731454.1 hypothetical protein [Streptomyces caniscabiei]WEO23558.1 hypothetical protein IHE65_10490 [Streptomyces caniscabiei]